MGQLCQGTTIDEEIDYLKRPWLFIGKIVLHATMLRRAGSRRRSLRPHSAILHRFHRHEG
jgi:hypothetical protein